MTPEQTPNDDITGLPGLRTWRSVYTVVMISFVVWIALLIALTRAYS